MIARVWHGFTLPSNAGKHAEHLQNELLRTYRGLSGNRGALLLARSQVGCAEFLVVSLWESAACLEALTGSPDIEKPIAQVEAHPDLLNPAPLVKHYEVVASTLSASE